MSENMNEENDFIEEELEETEESEEHSEDEASLKSSDNRKIRAQPSDPTVDSLYQDWKEGILITDPDFQRHHVWDIKKSSRLIESAVLRIPLPSIYLAEEPGGKATVIDGQQRLMAFFHFMEGKFKLSGLLTRHDLLGITYKQMGEKGGEYKSAQQMIKKCVLRTIRFEEDSDKSLKFEIFHRLNSGAVSLNDQEMRNCIFRGRYNNLLRELSKNKKFQEIMGFGGQHKRMKDVEYVLRFAAFFFQTYIRYKYPMKEFMNNEMDSRTNISDNDVSELKDAFRNAVDSIYTVFGPKAFRRWIVKDRKDNREEVVQEPARFSAALFDILMVSLARRDKNMVMRNVDSIREALIVLSAHNKDFIQYTERATSNTAVVQGRFKIWEQALDNVLKDEEKQPRCFSLELKEELYESNPTCALCNNRISHIDDAAIDHIEQYWLGGKTIPENARLTHRYCNNNRSRKESA